MQPERRQRAMVVPINDGKVPPPADDVPGQAEASLDRSPAGERPIPPLLPLAAVEEPDSELDFGPSLDDQELKRVSPSTFAQLQRLGTSILAASHRFQAQSLRLGVTGAFL